MEIANSLSSPNTAIKKENRSPNNTLIRIPNIPSQNYQIPHHHVNCTATSCRHQRHDTSMIAIQSMPRISQSEGRPPHVQWHKTDSNYAETHFIDEISPTARLYV